MFEFHLVIFREYAPNSKMTSYLGLVLVLQNQIKKIHKIIIQAAKQRYIPICIPLNNKFQ